MFGESKVKLSKKERQLIEAVQADDLPLAEKLLKGGALGFGKASPNEMDENALGAIHYPISGAMVDLLAKYKADVNLHGSYYDRGDRRPIHTAQNAEVTHHLRKHGARIGDRYKDSLNNALHCAKSPEQVDAVLEGEGKDLLNLVNRYGQTPKDVIKDQATRDHLHEKGGRTSEELKEAQKKLVAQKKIDDLDLGGQETGVSIT